MGHREWSFCSTKAARSACLSADQRRQALAVLYRSSRPVSRSVDLTRYAVAAIYQRRDDVPAEAAEEDPTVRLYLLGELRPSAFEDAAAEARARGELAREVHCRASIAPFPRAALGELEAARPPWPKRVSWPVASRAGDGAGNGSTSWARSMR